MGRKTNSVSLRLKKTNRDYNNCWYSDILYADSFSKSLKIENYVSQTLKTLGMPCPKTSVIGAFKKARLLVCYLDPKKRKRLLEKTSKGMQSKARTLQASVSKQNSTKGFLSLGKVKQDSKALLKPLNDILQTNSGPLPSQYRGEWPITGDYSSSYSTGSAFKANYTPQKPNHQFATQQAKLEQTLLSIAVPGKQSAIKKNKFCLKQKVEQNYESFSETTSTRLNYFYRGPIGLDLVQNKEFKMYQAHLTFAKQAKSLLSFSSICNFLCLARGIETTRKMPYKSKASKTNFTSRVSVFDAAGLTKNHQINNNNTSLKPFMFSSTAHLKTGTCFSLKGGFFVKKQENIFSNSCNLLDLPTLDYFTKKYQGKLHTLFLENNIFSKNSISASEPILQKDECKVSHAYTECVLPKNLSQSNFTGLEFFPFFLENKKSTTKVSSRFLNFSHFFYNEISNLAMISIFSKNSQIFGKNTESYNAFSGTPFSCLSEFLLNTACVMKNFNKKNVDVMVPQRVALTGHNPGFYDKKENCSLISLYGFYNGISSFWGNLVCLSFYKSTNETCCALFLAECVSYLLEKKVSFRSIKRQLLVELHQAKYGFLAEKPAVLWAPQSANLTSQALALPVLENKRKVTGIRITCSGRVGGRSKKAQRSRKDTFMWGETGLHVFSSKLDFAKTHAETPFGLVGVQVWVCSK